MTSQAATVHSPQTSSETRKPTSAGLISVHGSQSVELALDALVRSVGVRGSPISLFLGAGASISSGVPSAQACIWEWKRQIFLTNNPGLEDQFSEVSLEAVRRRIQDWLDRQGGYPREGDPDEYGFYVEKCFPRELDRRAFFQLKVRAATPHVGYHLVCHLAQAGLVRSVWSPNFDGLTARAAATFTLTPIEVGIDSQNRVLVPTKTGEILCVSMHGDYRYDGLKNTPQELQEQERALCEALAKELVNTDIIVCGYSGRDHSLLAAFREAFAREGTGALYWCGYGDAEPPKEIAALIEDVRRSKREAYYVSGLGFDDLMTRLALHCLRGEQRKTAERTIHRFAPSERLVRKPFDVPKLGSKTLIKSNAFLLECPSEVLQFDLAQWPKEKVWSFVRDAVRDRPVAAVPFRGHVLALGNLDDIKGAFGSNIKGEIVRTPVDPGELRYEDGAIVSLMSEALVRSMSEGGDVLTDGRRDLWRKNAAKSVVYMGTRYNLHDSVQLFIRKIGKEVYLALKPSLRVHDAAGNLAPNDVGNVLRLKELGYQHNKPFNQTLNGWRATLFPNAIATAEFEFPRHSASPFKFQVRRSPVFGEIGVAEGKTKLRVPDKLQPLVKYQGIQLSEPRLLFSNKAGDALVTSPHPVRGILENRPYDFALTARALSTEIRIGVVCPAAEASSLRAYVQRINASHAPGKAENDYLATYPGFHAAYGLPVHIPEIGHQGWYLCPEPVSGDPRLAAREVANQINRGVDALQSACAPHVVLIFFPERWREYRGYSGELERFDVHDYVKAFSVQRGMATQFLNEDTLTDSLQCRVWWWLSLALYTKAMRTPWLLDGIADNTAFVGLGFSIDPGAISGNHVVLGCSHIYNARGEGLQYRLTKIENPIIRQGNPFMSKDDARRTGETIRQLFFDARYKLPDRVVLHKRTSFTKDEREGLTEGLSGVRHIDMLEVQIDKAFRYVASVLQPDGSIDEDNFPVRRGTVMKLDEFSALLWVHGATTAVNANRKYFQGKRRIPAPLTLRRHGGDSDLVQIAGEILGLSKMNWNTLDLYTKFPATLQSSNEIARIGSMLQRFGSGSYDYRLFI